MLDRTNFSKGPKKTLLVGIFDLYFDKKSKYFQTR